MTTDRIIGLALSIVSIALTVCSLLSKRERYFNFRDIIKKHLSLFSKCKFQYIVFYFFPLLSSIGLSLLFPTNMAFFTHLGVVLSIILSMLLALLAILSGYDFSAFKDAKQRAKAETAVKETINAIFFCCIIGVLLLLIGFVVIATNGKSLNWLPINTVICKTVFSAFSYYLLIVVLLNLLLIIKNICKIIEVKMAIEGSSK